jgi:hypothetical protein
MPAKKPGSKCPYAEMTNAYAAIRTFLDKQNIVRLTTNYPGSEHGR